MTPVEVRNTIQARYLTEFSGQFPIALDNQEFDPPSNDKWVRVNVQFNDGAQDSLGRTANRKFIKSGILFIQVFTPANTATDDNDTLANDSLDLYDGEHLGDLWFINGRVRTVGADGTWYQQNAVLEFQFEQIK